MAAEVLVSDCAEGVVTLTLDRPRRKNALSIALRDEISDRLAELAGDDAVRVVVITGSQGMFSAGFDLKEFSQIGEREMADRIWASSDRFHRTVLEFPLPTLASVNGPALAGGFDLALMCDLRIASSAASFAHPEVSFGTVAYGLLHDLLGGSIARELALTGRPISADEALARGLVTQIVPVEDLPAATQELARSVAARPRDVLMSDKRKIIRRSNNRILGTLDL
ncbi:MAG: enoyl-CoA hydratase/isomerase family protein [bacterium]|nr:enoyl-CoA hydratase/isomerase family protein [bacterium]